MRYKPYDYEYAAITAMNNEELTDFFLSRIYETEEIWGLKERGSFWMTYNRKGEETLPVFPYKIMAEEACVNDWEVMIPVAESLEFFMEKSLPHLIHNKTVIEVMPGLERKGNIIITASQLFNILETMIDSGTYTMDG